MLFALAFLASLSLLVPLFAPLPLPLPPLFAVVVPAATAMAEFMLIRVLVLGLTLIIMVAGLVGLPVRVPRLMVPSTSLVAVHPAFVVTPGIVIPLPFADI